MKVFAVLLFAFVAQAWEYEALDARGRKNPEGPGNWGNRNPKWSLCNKGFSQSPIDFGPHCTAAYPLKPLLFNYLPVSGTSKAGSNSFKADQVTNDGHFPKISYEAGSFLSLSNDRFQVKEVHFHAPSEHKIEGHQFPLEMQIIHETSNGGIAAVSILYEEGRHNKFIDSVHWMALPHATASSPTEKHINLAQAIGFNTHYWSYGGSLTYPPCTEDVAWFIMQDIQEVSSEQVERLKGVVINPNNRPIQPTNGRKVGSSRGAKDGFPSTQYKMTGKVPSPFVVRPADSKMPNKDSKLDDLGVPRPTGNVAAKATASAKGEKKEDQKEAAVDAKEVEKVKEEEKAAADGEALCTCLATPWDCPCAPSVLRVWRVPQTVDSLGGDRASEGPTKSSKLDEMAQNMKPKELARMRQNVKARRSADFQ